MWANINLNCPLTLGELRELVNYGKLSEFSDDTQINMCINLCERNVIDITEEPSAPVMSIIGDEDEINFYNYI